MKEEKNYDVLVSVKCFVRVSAENKEEAVKMAENGSLADLFPNDISIDDIVEVSYGGRVFDADND